MGSTDGPGTLLGHATSATGDTVAAAPASPSTAAVASAATMPITAPVREHVATDATLASSDSVPGATAGASASSESASAHEPDYPDLVRVDPAHYVMGAKIAEGGMGLIRAARDRRLGRPVAIKSLLVQHGELAARFEREARITARLQHPAIVQLHEAGKWPSGEPFYAMKLVEGRSLDEVIADCRSLAERLALVPNVVAIADAIAYAHTHGVIHRDIKPKNVLVGSFGETVVIDWGLAKDLDDGEAPEVSVGPYRHAASGSTVVGSVLGTPTYMPIEQARGETVDKRADVYALGALLYHVLSGVPPYRGRNADDILASLKAAPPRPVAETQTNLPPDLVAIVDKAMARTADARYPTAAELAADLRRFTTGQLVGAHVYSTWQLVRRWVRRNRGVVIATALATFALVTFGTYSFQRIVHERDDATAARHATSEREERLAVEHARAQEADDPTMAVAALAKLAEDSPYWTEVRPLIVNAWGRGIAYRVLRGHDLASQRVALASDGRVISAGPEGVVRIWSADGTAQPSLEGHHLNVSDVAVSPDGASIASMGIDGTARLWRGGTGRVLSPEGEAVTRLVGFTSDSAEVVVLTRAALLVCPTHDAPCTRLVPKAPRSTRGTIRTVIEANGREITSRSTETWSDFVSEAEVSPNAHVAVLCDDRRATAWDLDAGTELWIDERDMHGCGFTPSGEIAIVAGANVELVGARTHGTGRVITGELPEGEHLLRGPLAFSRDGRWLATAYPHVAVWDLRAATPTRVHGFGHDKATVSRLAFSRDGDYLASAGGDGVHVLALRQAGTNNEVWSLPGARELAMSPDDNTMTTGYTDGTVRSWRLDDPRGRHTVRDLPINWVMTAADGAVAAYVAGDHFGAVSWRDGRVLGTYDLVKGCSDAAMSPDGRWMKQQCGAEVRVLAVADGAVKTFPYLGATWLRPDRLVAWRWKESSLAVIDVATGATRTVPIAAVTTTIVRVLASPRGDVVAVLRGGGSLAVVNAATGATVRTLDSPCAFDSPTAISDDGATFACGVGREIWVARDAGAPAKLRGHYEQVHGLAFLSGGELASTGQDKTLRVWNLGDGTSRAFSLGDDAAAIPVGAGSHTVITEGTPLRVWDLGTGRSWEFPLDGVDYAEPLEPDRSFAVETTTGLVVFSEDVPAAGPELWAWLRAHTQVSEP